MKDMLMLVAGVALMSFIAPIAFHLGMLTAKLMGWLFVAWNRSRKR